MTVLADDQELELYEGATVTTLGSGSESRSGRRAHPLLLRLTGQGTFCALCDGPLTQGARYLCGACSEAHRSFGVALPVTGEPAIRHGALCISHASSKRFHWWAGGQQCAQTAADLGAPQDVTDRYRPIYSKLEFISKEETKK